MFLYFVADETNRFGDEEIDRFGLRHAINDPRMGKVRRGPGGAAGVIVVERGMEFAPKYFPDSQTWHPRPGNESVWIGHPGKVPPRARALARDRQLPGAAVVLPDGERITVPHARRWVEHEERLLWSVALPQALRRDDDGQWVPRDVVRQYRRIWDLVGEYLDAREQAIRAADADDDGSIYFTFEAIDELAIAAITANYRIGPDEIEIMGSYDQRVRDQVIDVLIDEATRAAWVKKKLAAMTVDGGNSCDGGEPSITESKPDTGPPSPTSGHTVEGCTATEPGR